MSEESLLTKIPENTSFLQSTKFTFIFPTLPFLRYFCQSISIPGISTSEVTVSTPFSDTYRHGDKLSFETFNITAIVDEDLRVFEETYDWLTSLTFPEKFQQYLRGDRTRNRAYHDGVLTINTNSNIPNIRIQFFNCHPTSLSSVVFNTSDSSDSTPTIDVTFRYDYYKIDRLR